MSNESNSYKYNSPNSFYNLGDIDILTLSQDEISGLWKIYLSTSEHYVVSREFDKSKGMYANAPDAVIRRGLMDFSASLIGNELSLFAVMDMFIDRCFDNSVFDEYTTNAVWMCMDYPSYMEVEDILSSYGCRIVWAFEPTDEKYPLLGECMNKVVYKTPSSGAERDALVDRLVKELKSSRISSIFLNSDYMIEPILSDSRFDGLPIFIGQFSGKNEDEFTSFKYIGH